MGKTVINYTCNKKVSPRVQRYQSRKHLLQARTRLAGNIANHARRSEQAKVSSQNCVASIVEVPQGTAPRSEHSQVALQPRSSSGDTTFEINSTRSTLIHDPPQGTSDFEIPDCLNNECINNNPSTDQHTCVLVDASPVECASHFSRREKCLYKEASNMSEDFNYKLAQLSTRHSLSNVCIDDILKLCQQLLYSKEDVPLPRSFKYWEESFDGQELIEMNFYWICEQCSIVNFRALKDTPFSMKCCNKQITQTDDHFVIFNIFDILELKLPSIHSKFKRNILSRRLEKVFTEQQVTDEDILLTLNIDGVPRCTSSSAALYPVLAYFDDLSHWEKKEHIMIFGIWVGKEGGKLNVKSFLSPIIEQLRELHENGLLWKNKNGDNIKSRVFVTSVLCDSIARPQVQSMKQFNAEYGCGYCFHKESGHYFTPTASPAALRTNRDHRHLSATTKDQYGIKDDCIFESLIYFDVIQDFAPCILHSLYLGIAKQFLSIWLSQRKSFGYGFTPKQVQEIDLFLKNLKPPHRVSRCPRSLKFFKFYKGHELAMWLFYYSPIVLTQILPPQYYKHWLELLKGTSKLLRKTISSVDITEAEAHLSSFVMDVLHLYGRDNCTYNVHLLSHMSWFAANKGPLQNYSMSIFENHNMRIKGYITSSQFLSFQICSRYFRDVIVQVQSSSDEEALSTGNIQVSSPIENENIDESMLTVVHNYFKNVKFSCFGLLRAEKKRYYSLLYKKVKKRNSCCFLVTNSQVFEVHFFVLYKSSHFAVGDLYDTEIFQGLIYIRKALNSTVTIKPLRQLGNVVIKLSMQQQVYFGEFLNDVENYAE